MSEGVVESGKLVSLVYAKLIGWIVLNIAWHVQNDEMIGYLIRCATQSIIIGNDKIKDNNNITLGKT